MKQLLTLNGFIQSKRFEKLYERRIEKLKRILTNFVTDIPKFTLHMKKHDKNHFYSSTMMITLPKKSLIVHTGGHYPEKVMIDSFEKIYKELEKYKGTHFSRNSKDMHHSINCNLIFERG